MQQFAKSRPETLHRHQKFSVVNPSNDNSDDYEAFLKAFTSDQLKIMAYVLSMIHDKTAAHDVYQETALALWKSFSTYDPEQNFLNWSLGVARHQVLRYWRTRKQDRHVFSEAMLTELADEGIEMAEELGPRQSALNECLSRLTARQNQLIQQFYAEGEPAASIAQSWGRSVHAVYKSLKVVRAALLECVERKLAEEPSC